MAESEVVQQVHDMASAKDGNLGTFQTIPVIDLSATFGNDAQNKRILATEIRRACIEVGFLYIKGHGVPEPVIADTFSEAERYFARPYAQKMKSHVSRSANIRGYAGLLEENTDPDGKGDWHESFDIALEVDPEDPDIAAGSNLYGPNQWPEGDSRFRDVLLRYYDEMRGLSGRLLHAFALALELDEIYFDSLVTKPLATLRILHYPPQSGEVDDAQIGIGAHSDYECFTILAQDSIPALQVRNQDGDWIAANPIPGCFLINIGDQMARWTNDLFSSTVHRAVNRSGRERYSIPFFFGPNYDSLIEVLPKCTSEETPAKYPPIRSGDYINARFKDTFAHYKAAQEAL